jgi:hypothetical protein
MSSADYLFSPLNIHKNILDGYLMNTFTISRKRLSTCRKTLFPEQVESQFVPRHIPISVLLHFPPTHPALFAIVLFLRGE